MKKAIGLLVVVGCLVVLARMLGPKLMAACDRMFEKMPEDFPPKKMLTNLTAIREDTTRILELLEKDRREQLQEQGP